MKTTVLEFYNNALSANAIAKYQQSPYEQRTLGIIENACYPVQENFVVKVNGIEIYCLLMPDKSNTKVFMDFKEPVDYDQHFELTDEIEFEMYRKPESK